MAYVDLYDTYFEVEYEHVEEFINGCAEIDLSAVEECIAERRKFLNRHFPTESKVGLGPSVYDQTVEELTEKLSNLPLETLDKIVKEHCK